MSIDPALYIVATPLGNVEDLSPRARTVLEEADLVLAEDSRRAGLLFKRLGIESSGFMSFHEHNEDGRIPAVLASLEDGRSVALISDAGTPLINDPGFTLVRACRERGIAVAPVPGPCAPVTALMACGLPPSPFTFLGFVPRKSGARRALFEQFGKVPATLVFFERKSRLEDTLADAYAALGPREVCVTRELTKIHEEFIVGRLDALDALDVPLRGEFTVVIGPPEARAKSGEDEIARLLAEETEAGGKPKDIARRVAARAAGWRSKEIYEFARSQVIKSG